MRECALSSDGLLESRTRGPTAVDLAIEKADLDELACYFFNVRTHNIRRIGSRE